MNASGAAFEARQYLRDSERARMRQVHDFLQEVGM